MGGERLPRKADEAGKRKTPSEQALRIQWPGEVKFPKDITPREEGYKALGVWITFDGHFTKELAEREVATWRRFYVLRHLLCDNNVALKYRLRLLTSCVVSSMYWCAGSWILTRTQCAHLRAVQDRMFEKDDLCPEMSCGKRGISHGEVVTTAPQLQGKAQFPTWRRNVFRQLFLVVWTHCTNYDMGFEQGKKKAVPAQEYGLARSLKKELGTQSHGRRFRVWRWEQSVAQCLGDDWTEKAQNKNQWRAKLDEMINRKKQKMEDRTCVALE